MAVDILENVDTAFYPMASATDLEHTVKLVEDTGPRIVARKADVRDQVALDAVVAEAIGSFDMMMNQATYDVFRPEIDHPTKEDATEVFRTMQVLPTDWLEPRDVSEIIAFLASDAARFITGVAMPVDAGQIGRG